MNAKNSAFDERLEKIIIRHKDMPKDILIYDINGPMFFGAAQKALKTLVNINEQKNIVILNDILLQNGYDREGKLTALIVILFDNCILNNTNEDENYLLIVILNKLESNTIGI